MLFGTLGLVWSLGGSAAFAAIQQPGLVVTGDPTAEEIGTITAVWGHLTTFLAPQQECLGEIEVMVVDRAEDFYGGRDVGSIAAFYRAGEKPIVFVEHGKVKPNVLIHEFAHHVDLSCGVGDSAVGEAIRQSQGLLPDVPWLQGSAWWTVPAEIFAEAVASVFGQPARIDVSDEAQRAVWDLARKPLSPNPVVDLLRDRTGVDLARVEFTRVGVVGAL
ncbi:hypothetical protein HQ535_02130 [bacterium]|nr:hypothetical protein [bacterium]